MIEHVDFTAPRTPCKTEGCGHPNYHVCTYGKPDLFPALLMAEERRGRKYPGRKMSERTQEHRDAISEAQQARWAAIKEENQERDAQIVARWKQEPPVSLRVMGDFFGISKNSVLKILKEAQDAGDTEISIRTRGRNIRHGG